MARLTKIEKNRRRRERRDVRKLRQIWWKKNWKSVATTALTGLVCLVAVAVIGYSRIRKTPPKARPVTTPVQWAETAIAAYQEGDGDSAIRAMENVSESESPYRFAANRWLAELLVAGLAHRRDSLAVRAVATHLQRAIRDEDVDARVATGLIELALGGEASGIENWRVSANHEPPRSDLLLPLSWALAQEGRTSESKQFLARAESHYRRVVDAGSDDLWAHIGLIETLVASKKLDDALTAWTVARDQFRVEGETQFSGSASLDHARARVAMQRASTASVNETIELLQEAAAEIPDCVAIWRAWFRLRSKHRGGLTASQLAWAKQYSKRPAYRIAASQVVLDSDVQVAPAAIRSLAEVYGDYIVDHPNDPNAIHLLCRTVLRSSGLPEILLGVADVDADGLNLIAEEPLDELTQGKVNGSISDTMMDLVRANQHREDYKQTLALALARDEQFGMAIQLLQTASFLHPDDRWVHEILALCQEATGQDERTQQIRRYIRQSCRDRVVLVHTSDPSEGVRMVDFSRELFRGLKAKPAETIEAWNDPKRPGQLGSKALDQPYLKLLYQPAWSPSAD